MGDTVDPSNDRGRLEAKLTSSTVLRQAGTDRQTGDLLKRRSDGTFVCGA
jgi:hypothetical protein